MWNGCSPSSRPQPGFNGVPTPSEKWHETEGSRTSPSGSESSSSKPARRTDTPDPPSRLSPRRHSGHGSAGGSGKRTRPQHTQNRSIQGDDSNAAKNHGGTYGGGVKRITTMPYTALPGKSHKNYRRTPKKNETREKSVACTKSRNTTLLERSAQPRFPPAGWDPMGKRVSGLPGSCPETLSSLSPRPLESTISDRLVPTPQSVSPTQNRPLSGAVIAFLMPALGVRVMSTL